MGRDPEQQHRAEAQVLLRAAQDTGRLDARLFLTAAAFQKYPAVAEEALLGAATANGRLQRIPTFPAQTVIDTVTGATFSPNRQFLAIAASTGAPPNGNATVFVWPADGRGHPRSVPAPNGTNGAEALAFSPDGTRLAVGGPTGEVEILTTDKWRPMTTLPRPAEIRDKTITGLSFAPDGHALAVGDSGGTIRIWNLDRGEETDRFAGTSRQGDE